MNKDNIIILNLSEFDIENGFVEFGSRMSESSSEPHKLIQMIKLLK